MNEPAFLPSHRNLASLPYPHKNHIIPQGPEHAFSPVMTHVNKYPTLTTKPTPSPRLYLRQKQPQWASPRLPLAPLSDNLTLGPVRVSDPAPLSPSNSPPLYNFLPQYEHEHGHRQYEQASQLLPPHRPLSATSSVTYLQTAAAAVIATAHKTHFKHPPLSSPHDRVSAKPHNSHFGDEGDDGPAEYVFSRGGRQGEPGDEERAMERYCGDVERQHTFAPTHPSVPLPLLPGAPSLPRDVSGMRDSPHFRPTAQHNSMYQRPRPQQKQQHQNQRQQYDVSDLGHYSVHSAFGPIEHCRGLGHVGSFFQEQHNNNRPPSPPQHVDHGHDSTRRWLPLGLQGPRDLDYLNRYVDVENEFLHPQPIRSIAQHLYECQDQGDPADGHHYSTWTHPRSRRDRILPSQGLLQDDDSRHHTTTNHSGPHPPQGTQIQFASSRQYQDEEKVEPTGEGEPELELDDPASAHQSCIETLSQLEQDLTEMRSRYNALQREFDDLRRSNEQMVMDHAQEVQVLQQEHRQALDELCKRARQYHEESIQRHKDKESKRQSVSHDQLRQVLESNKAFRAKVRALERGRIEAEKEQREEMALLTGLVEKMVAQVKNTTTTTTAKMSEQYTLSPRRQEMEQTLKTSISGTSPTLILSPQEIPSQTGKDEAVSVSLKSPHGQKCHATLLQLQNLMDHLSKASTTSTETFKGHAVDLDLEEAPKQRRRIKRQSGGSASSSETLVMSTATTTGGKQAVAERGDNPSALARQLLLEQQYRHQVEIEQIKKQCVALYHASLTELRAEMKSKLAKMKKTPVPSFGH